KPTVGISASDVRHPAARSIAEPRTDGENVIQACRTLECNVRTCGEVIAVAECCRPTSLYTDHNRSELVLHAKVCPHKRIVMVRVDVRSEVGETYVDARPLVAGADTEVDTAPVRRPLVGDLRWSIHVGKRYTGASQCRRGRDDRPGGEFANLVHC